MAAVMASHVEMLLRIVAGAALGGVIGYERDVHGRPVGLRTHLIVAMAAATFMVVSTQFAYLQEYAHGGVVEVDGSRIAASVVSGIGFLAGGAILKTGMTIQGLTTAAGLWLVTAIGLCAGGGMYVEAAAVTLLGVAALTALRRFEDKDDRVVRRLSLVLSAKESVGVPELLAGLADLGVDLAEVEYDCHLDDVHGTSMTFDVKVPQGVGTTGLLAHLESLPGVRRVQLRVPI